jgi:hypothetical protein
VRGRLAGSKGGDRIMGFVCRTVQLYDRLYYRAIGYACNMYSQ